MDGWKDSMLWAYHMSNGKLTLILLMFDVSEKQALTKANIPSATAFYYTQSERCVLSVIQRFAMPLFQQWEVCNKCQHRHSMEQLDSKKLFA
jgi:hypothetical protein